VVDVIFRSCGLPEALNRKGRKERKGEIRFMQAMTKRIFAERSLN